MPRQTPAPGEELTPGAGSGLHALVLAAGAATRFGSAKQLLCADGEPLVRAVAGRAAQVVGNAVLVVLGARAHALLEVLDGYRCITNPEWPEGIASSIRTGLAALPRDCPGVLMLLADQAAVTVEDLQELVSVWSKAPDRIAAARYDETLGVPAIFPRSWFRELERLQGDTGARALLHRDPSRVLAVPMPHAALDIDTPEDWQALRGR